MTDGDGKPLTGIIAVTFLLYKDAEGGAPLWLETQNVEPDKKGHYTVMLGSTSTGLPSELFVASEARWLGVRPQDREELPRIMLLSVPYALKAADAETIGGLPPSAFLLAGPIQSAASTLSPITASPAASSAQSPIDVAGTGTTDFIALWTDNNGTLGNSVIFQSGSGSTAKIGINTTSPASTLDVAGGSTVRGTFSLPATGNATSSAGKNSQPQNFTASSFNSSTKKAVNQTFGWQAEPAGNNTSNPSGTLNLLFGSGSSTPAETGLKISNTGVFTFAGGQTFPGAGTITGITAGSGLSGGGSSGNVSLSLASAACTGGQAVIALPLTCQPFATLGSNLFSGCETVTGQVNANVFSGAAFFGGLVAGAVNSTTITAPAVAGVTVSQNGEGMFGEAVSESHTAASFMTCCPVGVWGDTGANGSGPVGVVATADDAKALFAENNSSTGFPTGFFIATSTKPNASALTAGGPKLSCSFDNGGNLFCQGSKSAVVTVNDSQRQVALYAVEAPQNWFEDFGSARLSGGVTVVQLETTFAQTINTDIDYHVFLTPNGDSRGLYVSAKTPTSFEVREQGGGTSSIAFDYRIVALRRGYENVRLEDKTEMIEKLKMNVPTPHSAMTGGKVAAPVAPDGRPK